MAVIKEYFCPGHGDFESAEARCPHGCTVVAEREFRTAPAYHNGNFRKTDNLVRSQVEAMGLSNIRSSREGEVARIQSPEAKRMEEFQKAVKNRYPSLWGSMPQGGAPAALAAHKAPATQAIDKQALAQHKRPTEIIRDPQNLKMDVSKAA